jgi:cytidylate kinase
MSIRIAEAQFSAINGFADKGSCVIMGRCADFVLSDRPNVISVFIKADMASRIERAVRLYNITPEEAKKLIKKTRFSKYFRLALHGWMEYHIAAVETSTTSFLSNPAGRNARKTLELNFRPKAK